MSGVNTLQDVQQKVVMVSSSSSSSSSLNSPSSLSSNSPIAIWPEPKAIGNFRSEYEYDYEYEFSLLSTRTLKNVDLET